MQLKNLELTFFAHQKTAFKTVTNDWQRLNMFHI